LTSLLLTSGRAKGLIAKAVDEPDEFPYCRTVCGGLATFARFSGLTLLARAAPLSRPSSAEALLFSGLGFDLCLCLYFARGDLHNASAIADYVGWALLAFRTSGHHPSLMISR
jgi:hypothetical protein